MLIMTLVTTKYAIVGGVIGEMQGTSIWPLGRWVTSYIFYLISYTLTLQPVSYFLSNISSTSYNAILLAFPTPFSPFFSCLRIPVPFDTTQALLSLTTVQTLDPIPLITVTKTVSDEQEEDYNDLPG